jgi:hypothetical protein
MENLINGIEEFKPQAQKPTHRDDMASAEKIQALGLGK